ncbi:glycosyltransferase family 4 protein [Thermococcus sibiricus]|uniref:Glycosyltransferase (Modular protein) n=1 Tax=Thermococcus sibiricus TaxID=172049 RepID=A0A124FF53_9EURY|nr:glycosyltransferase family 4 protein [Thermococcus sibiricus]KUK17004.1 MAG: Glycosyltransferase (Modular protein) [Thermococcus sibiricus]
MKIAQVSATFPPYMAGTGNVCYHYAMELAKLGHEVTVFTSRYPDEDYAYPDIITVKRFKPLFRIGNAPFIPQLLREIQDFDIVHLHYPFFFGGELIYFLKKLRNQKYVVTYHNDVILLGMWGIPLKFYKTMVMKQILKNAEKIIVTSMDYARNSDLWKISRAREKIVEVPNGVDINKFSPKISGEEIKTMYNIEDKDIVLFVGALDKAHYFKGVEYLLQSFATIEDRNSILIIVGDGDLKGYYMRLAESLRLKKRVLFTGRVPDKDLPKYYASADVVVLPSITMGEAFGLVLVEGMATGKPVIGSNLPGVRTVVDDGINGYLVEPKNTAELSEKINYLLENEKIRKKFGKRGRKKVEKLYSWKKIAKRLENIYTGVI